MKTAPEDQWERVRTRYAMTAELGGCCSEGTDCPSGYSAEDLAGTPSEAVLGLGSGNPVRFAEIQPEETVVDLGSGAGIDVFLAAQKVGPQGRAIGVDMTPEMIARARRAAARTQRTNVEFRLGRIEDLPLASDSVDVVLSNCVINLSPDKAAVFREAFRVLRPRGRLVISDIVQERELLLAEDDCNCVATAMRRDVYMEAIRTAGFRELEIRADSPWKTGPSGIEASAITIVTRKSSNEVNL